MTAPKKPWRPKCECNSKLRKRGTYRTAAGAVPRWYCPGCNLYFSAKQGSVDAYAKRPELRAAILRLHLRGVSYREIGRQLRCSADTARRAVLRAYAWADANAEAEA